MSQPRMLTPAQLRAELSRCEFCEEKPCRTACPANCSPADFIMASRVGEPGDLKRAAAEIMMANPMGGVCGYVCPDHHCKNACVRKDIDRPVEIPSVQATLVAMAKALDGMPKLPKTGKTREKVAVLGAGPAGLGAAAFLARKGHRVDIFDERAEAGGTVNLIPEHRLPRQVLQSDIEWVLGLGDIRTHLGKRVADPMTLLSDKRRGGAFDALVVATGLTAPIQLGIKGEHRAISGFDYLARPIDLPGVVAVVGGGATAVDCAVTAKRGGARRVEIICLERLDEMPLSSSERDELMEHGIEISGRTAVRRIREGFVTTQRVEVDGPFRLDAVREVEGTKRRRPDIDHLIVAIGARPELPRVDDPRVFYAGDFHNGPTTVVTASASGKNAAMQVEAFLAGETAEIALHTKSWTPVPGYERLPVPLTTDFFGRTLRSPFLLSAAPPSDGYEQMKRAYEAGWAGGVMKTAFDGVPIHIPGEYMHVFSERTWGNCDNVSGHSLDRVCEEIGRLVAEYPDRLTIGSTGGPITGNDKADRKGWQSNTRKLENAGAMAIEYSLSCPQGGDGTEGDIVSQSPALTAKIVEWILSGSGKPEVPKLFKLTAAVTSIEVILQAIAEVLARYPDHKAGVTLANTFPTVNFRPRPGGRWDEAIVVGMSGEGVAPISNFTLSRAGASGIYVSGNGGPMDHKAAAHFLALGAGTVQFCTIVMKHGYGIIDHLESGLSHLLAERGIGSVAELTGRAQPDPITDFMALSAEKKLSAVTDELCVHCGNCSRCPYLAIHLDERGIPVTDASKCVGCSICVQKCPSGALMMRPRSAVEAAALVEA